MRKAEYATALVKPDKHVECIVCNGKNMNTAVRVTWTTTGGLAVDYCEDCVKRLHETLTKGALG